MVFCGGHLWLWCYASIHLPIRPQSQHGGLYQVPGGCSTDLDWESGYWKTLHLATGLCTMPHMQENLELAMRKFLWSHHPLISGHLTPQIAVSLIIMCKAWLSERLLCSAKDELKARIIVAFTNLNKETIGKSCRRFQSCLEAMVETNSNSFD